MPAKIPATVITGFLGSGKTTLIRHLLANAGGRRIALIINEFGDVGVDGEILKGCGDVSCSGDDVVELSNGCICCTVAEDFIPTMQQLIDRSDPPEHIVIETSGLALPQPLVAAFNWPEISTRVTVDGVVTVVDGRAAADGQFAHNVAAVNAQRLADESLDHETPLSELFEDQIAAADMIVINKSDLLSDEEVETLVADLNSKARAGVRVVTTAMGALPAEVVLGIDARAEADMAARHSVHHDHDHHDHDHDDFESFVVIRPEIDNPAAFAGRLSETINTHRILRLKGFGAVAGKPMRLAMQAVGPRVETYFDRPLHPDEPRETRLVVIGKSGMDHAAITAALTE